jgi:hypothetical protein
MRRASFQPMAGDAVAEFPQPALDCLETFSNAQILDSGALL